MIRDWTQLWQLLPGATRRGAGGLAGDVTDGSRTTDHGIMGHLEVAPRGEKEDLDLPVTQYLGGESYWLRKRRRRRIMKSRRHFPLPRWA